MIVINTSPPDSRSAGLRSPFRSLPRRPVVLLLLTLGSAAGALTLVTVSARRTYRTLETAATRRQAAYEFLMALRQMRQHVGEVRVGLTGYALARDSLYSATYATGMGGLAGDTMTLRRLAAEQPTLQRELDRLGPALRSYADAMASAMQAVEGGPRAGLSATLHRSRDAVLLEGIRGVIVSLEREQTRLMAAGATEVAQAVERSNAMITWALVVGVVMVLGAGGAAFAWLLGREMERRLRGYAARLAEDARKLGEANKELDSFAYSVSHDLRAPLRAVDGFTRLLIEDHGERMDDSGRQLAARIRSAAANMSRLIDDLLAFSRLGRQPLRVGRLEMDSLVRTAIEDLRSLEANRVIEFRVGPLPPAVGDPSLLREVWLNLLGNAVKYTRPRAHAVVDVAGTVTSDEIVYSIRDNGVGFDMQYVEKLFGVFQRLHGASEFEGTGVGLALVQRIVHRHGGRVWAEGRLNEGATLSFTLPTSKSSGAGA